MLQSELGVSMMNVKISWLLLFTLTMDTGICCFSNVGSGGIEVKGYIHDKEGDPVGLNSNYAMNGWIDSVFSRVVSTMTDQINENLAHTSMNTTKIWGLIIGLGVCVLLVIFRVYLGKHYKGKREKINLEVRRADRAIENNMNNDNAPANNNNV